MRIAVNARMLLHERLDGIGRYAHEILSRLVNLAPEVSFTFFFDRKWHDSFVYSDNILPVALFPPARHPYLYHAFFQWSVPRALKKYGADCYFSPDGFLTLKSSIPQYPVIHDLNFEHRPQDLPPVYGRYYRSWFPKFAKVATQVFTVSQFTATDLEKTYGISRSHIHLTPNAPHPAYRPLTDEEKTAGRKKFAREKPYFVFVGNFSQRKNLHGLIAAYDFYRMSHGSFHLVLVGDSLWKYPEMEEALGRTSFRDDIHFTGRLTVDEVALAVGSSSGLVFVSYFEGFGIPIVEAFSSRVPVITSDRTAMPEVAGGAALYASPDDHRQIAEQMLKLERDASLGQKLIELGAERVNQFSWDHSARIVWEVISKHSAPASVHYGT
ncbi:MAG: glycosyltransferase family 1 protein [Salibacteraceae bacterium]